MRYDRRVTVVRSVGASVLLALSGCALLIDIPETPNSDPLDVRRKEVFLQAELNPEDPPLIDYPVPITIVGDPDIAARARFENIRFTDEDDEPVAYEIEHYDPETGSVHAWVKLPVVHPDTTLVHIYYGGPDDPDRNDPSALWSVDLFAGVWHLSTEPPYGDSTFGGNKMQQAADSPPDPIDGAFGNAILFDGGADQHLRIADPDDGSLDLGTGSFAVSLWVRVEMSAGADDVPFAKGGLSDDPPGYGIHMGTGDWTGSFSDGTTFTGLLIGRQSDFLGAWHFLGIRFNRDSGENVACVFSDESEGECAADLVDIDSLDTDADIAVGTNYEGRIDEIRVYRDLPPRGALLLEYQAKTKVDFYELGPETVPE